MEEKIKSLQVRNGFEILELLIKSQRIFSDISMFFQYRVLGTTSGHIHLILRDWMDKIPQDHEFRCYVHKGKMTAISQYHCYYRFEALQDQAHVEKIRDAILQFHEEVKKWMTVNSYVIDIVVLPDYSCSVIELNPFGSHMSSGAALFNWEKDYALMYDLFGPTETSDTGPF